MRISRGAHTLRLLSRTLAVRSLLSIPFPLVSTTLWIFLWKENGNDLLFCETNKTCTALSGHRRGCRLNYLFILIIYQSFAYNFWRFKIPSQWRRRCRYRVAWVIRWQRHINTQFNAFNVPVGEQRTNKWRQLETSWSTCLFVCLHQCVLHQQSQTDDGG